MRLAAAFPGGLILLISAMLRAEAPQPSAPAQPIPFSHKQHISTGLKCQECHPNPDPGEAMELPAAGKCMFCHVAIAKNSPAIQKLSEYAKNKQAIPWARIYQLPDWVFWSHRVHLQANQSCDSCHGPVSSMEATVQATTVTTMAGCIACHQKNNAPTGCQSCHEGKNP